MTYTITFNELRKIKDMLPHGSMQRIAEELEHVQSKGFVTKLIWHERSHLDPAMQWMRGMISYAVKETLSGGHVVHPEGGR